MKAQFHQDMLQTEIKKQGADFMHFVDISQLPVEQRKGYPTAILIGIVLSRDYLRTVAGNPNYVGQMIENKQIETDEFHLAEIKTDQIADHIASYLSSIGFGAYSQSEDNISKTGYYHTESLTTPLPHKTIAGLAGLGWIGKHNLLVTPAYGSAISMCTILTDAPLKTIVKKPIVSRCGDCNSCEKICLVNAIKGTSWSYGIARDEIVDVFSCRTCFQCVVQCPWTQKYINQQE